MLYLFSEVNKCTLRKKAGTIICKKLRDSNKERIDMKTVFTLTSAESRRLISKAVVAIPAVKEAWAKAYLLLAGGTTNAFIAQELIGKDGIEPARCTVGVSTDGLLCITHPDSRKVFPNVFFKGASVDKSLTEALADHHDETVVIKGANAVDMDGNVGVVTAGFDGGTIPRIIGPVTSKGLTYITPVGLEKLIPSVPAAADAVGAKHIDISMGADFGMYCLPNTTVITEIEAIDILFDLETTLICCGGIGGNEGAVTLAVDGDEADVVALVEFLENEIKGEPAIKGNKGICDSCSYKNCRYYGKKVSELPAWMQK